jgi:hypothetical protein
MGRNTKDWVYTSAQDIKGGKLIVTVEDLPGNKTMRELMLP